MKQIRTRYAPSPTGFFHIGGARTAINNYLFAKHFGGTFILRFEDTDVERHIEDGIESQFAGLEWLGIIPDESTKKEGPFGPYRQTQKLKVYQDLAYKLVEENKAYYCFCTKEELEEKRKKALANDLPTKYDRTCLHLTKEQIQEKLAQNIPYVIRLKMEDNVVIEWDDLVRGKISVPTDSLTDPVILRSNGIPLYNFAVVIDDEQMQITHVLRGEEHISNTPYQIAIKKALGYSSEITYGHLSIIINNEGKKLSKRDTSLKQFIEDYKKMGYYNKAIFNFLSLLSWNPGDNIEIKTQDEIIKLFDGSRLSSTPAFFDENKLNWISKEYFKKISDEEYLEYVKDFLTIDLQDLNDKKNEIILLFKKEIYCASQLNELVENTFFNKNKSNDEILNSENGKKVISEFAKQITSCEITSDDQVKTLIQNIKTNTGANGKDLFMPIRIALTNNEHGPELVKIIKILGKEKITLLLK